MDIKKVMRLVTPLAIPGVMKCKQRQTGRLAENLTAMHTVTRNISYSKPFTHIDVQVLDDAPLYKLLAGEAYQFLLASRITLERCKQTHSDNAAWQTIEQYYSALYAIHYLIRLTGTWITHLDDAAMKIILGNQQYAVPPTKGIYTLNFDETSSTLRLTKRDKSTSGGSHKDAWEAWINLVNKVCTVSLQDPVEYAREHIGLIEHKKVLSKNPGEYFAPSFRGDINYQFKGGTWHFESNSRISVTKAQTMITTPASIPGSASQLEKFISQNQFIIDLAHLAATHTIESYPQSIIRSIANQYKRYF